MATTEYLTLQRAEVTTDQGLSPRRMLRLRLGAGLSCDQETDGSSVSATLTSSSSGPSSAATVPMLAAPSLVERADGVVVAANILHSAADYTGSTSLKAVLASPTGSVVRVRLWDLAGGAYVSGAALTTSSTSPTIKTSSSLSLSSTEKIYELHLDIDGSGDDDDSGICSFAALRSA